MNKKILYIIFGVALLCLIGFFVYSSQKNLNEDSSLITNSEDVKIDNNQGGRDSSVVNTEKQPPKPIDQNTKDKVFALVERYIKYAENKDIENIKALSYQVSPACKNYTQSEQNKKECDTKLNAAAVIGRELKKDKMVFLWQDKKQIILASDFFFEENDTMISKIRAMVYVVLDSSNNMKILSYNHAKGSVLPKLDFKREDLLKRLTTYTEDKDEDGMEDYLEDCLSSSQDGTCLKTDINNKDSDGDGFWDGIEALFYK